MARVTWADAAKHDFHELVEWIARDSLTAAEKWAIKIRTAPDVLERFPEIGSPVEEFDLPGLRELLVGSFRIVYLFHDDECRILTVARAERDLRRVLDPENLP
jgi:plasmid stabilization system protein ParE